MTVRYGGQVLPHTLIPNSQNVLVTVPRLAGSRPFTATFASYPGTIQSPNFNCILPATGSLEVINNAQWRATSIRLDGTEYLAPAILPSTQRTTFNNIPNGNHTIAVVLGTAAVPVMFNQSGTFTINGGLTSSIATTPFTLADIVTNFQPSRTFYLTASLTDDWRYTINRNGTWSWFDNGTIFPGPGFATWMTPTSWPTDATSIAFRFNDANGTNAVYDILTGMLAVNGNEFYYP